MNRKFIMSGAIACACLGVGAAPAVAAPIPVQLKFDHVVLDTPATPKTQVVSPSTQPLQVTADVDPDTGNFTVQPSDWSFPTYHMSSPVSGTVDINLNGPASGHVDFMTGQLTFTADFLAKITITGQGDCTKDTGSLTLSTATTEPLPGHAFPAGETGVATGDGAFGVGWSSLPPGTGPACPVVDPAVQGPGGVWISRGISPVPPTIAVKVKKLGSVKAGATATVKATISDSGSDDSNSLKVCLAAPKSLRPKHSCQTITSLAAGKSKTLSFRVKTSKKKPGKYTLTLGVSGTGVKSVSHKLTLKVRKH